MVNKSEIVASLAAHLGSLKAKAQAGCEDSHIQWAMGKAIHDVLKANPESELTDLDWFKGTTYYTGDKGSNREVA